MFMRNVCLLALLVITLVGCGGGRTSPRRAVQGDVTLGGAPLDRGTITFYPSTGTAGAAGGALIENGQYQIPADKGLEPGKYRVQLSSPTPSTATAEDYAAGNMPLTSNDRIPPEFNERSQQVIEVTPNGDNRFDFAVP